MLKNLQARLQEYVNRELPDVQAGFRKGRGTRDRISIICWITEQARKFQKNFCFIDCAKAFDCVDHNKLWKILKEMGKPDHLTRLPRNLYAGVPRVSTKLSNLLALSCSWGFPGGSDGKESTYNEGNLGSIPGLGRYPGKGNSYLLQYSGLENSMDCIVHGVAKSRTQLNDFHIFGH